MHSLLLISSLFAVAFTAQVTVVNRCPFDLRAGGANVPNGQSTSIELTESGFGVNNAADGRELAKFVLDNTPNKNHYNGNIVIGSRVVFSIGGGEKTWEDAYIVYSNGVNGQMGNDESVGGNAFSCAAETCIYDYLFPKVNTVGLVVSFC
ncbi:hypothetical protein PMAYCL1PPCAC_13431 [Pristionchus mayeri]|uniref:Uncharacterized protein n=1 Tax=Pristionchus mayeri TaxID=1317129 RepID=A0AAN5CHA5_9BILA|nr:hypothetical protein PMAYCL1PPCAC_13431 [Pristionchus mayeri]